MKVLLGICGSIAAYKSCEFIRMLVKESHEVRVIMTKSALKFVTPLTFQTLSQNEVYVDQFVMGKGIGHIDLSQWADCLVIAPATANIIGKARAGIGDDLLSTTIISFDGAILFAPAMAQEMWQNPIVQDNIKNLKEKGYYFVEPGLGPLASGRIGKGRFPAITRIYQRLVAICERKKSLKGRKFLITGGRTEEDLDPVRVITNRSTGKMAASLISAVIARDGMARGIFGEVSVALPEAEILRVRTSEELLNTLQKNIPWCDFLIMAAAVGDYRPSGFSPTKVHRKKFPIALEKNIDLLQKIKADKKNKIFVGFSLEDKNQIKRAREKMAKKSVDLMVLNEPDAIGSQRIQARLMRGSGKLMTFSPMSKERLADAILDECLNLEKSKGKR